MKVVVSLVAFAAALCALVPRVKNYGELAGQARELTSRYGGVVGDLLDLAKMEALDSDAARPVVEEFEAIKEKKDGLRRVAGPRLRRDRTDQRGGEGPRGAGRPRRCQGQGEGAVVRRSDTRHTAEVGPETRSGVARRLCLGLRGWWGRVAELLANGQVGTDLLPPDAPWQGRRAMEAHRGHPRIECRHERLAGDLGRLALPVDAELVDISAVIGRSWSQARSTG